MKETCVTAVSQVGNFVDAEILFIIPVEAHLGREVKSYTEKLREGIDVVCQAFFLVVLVDLLFI